jgi:hypothetical protein
MQNLNRWRRRWEPPAWRPPQRPNASYTTVAAVLSRAQPYAGQSYAKSLGTRSHCLSTSRRFQTVRRHARLAWPQPVAESPDIGQVTMPMMMGSRVRIFRGGEFQTEALPAFHSLRPAICTANAQSFARTSHEVIHRISTAYPPGCPPAHPLTQTAPGDPRG